MNRFKPDCLFLSAGFDAHKKDGINAGYIALVRTPCSEQILPRYSRIRLLVVGGG